MIAMLGRLVGGCLGICVLVCAQPAPPEGLLTRIKARVDENLKRMPDYTCMQVVERAWRDSPKAQFKVNDTLRLEVGLVNGKERFSWLDAKQFEDKNLADMIGAGATGTGSFALHAGSVFKPRVADFTYQGEETWDGRGVIRYDYEVPLERSGYRLRVSSQEALVPFRGSFWVDKETFDMIRLEVNADDIPPALGLAQASDMVNYKRVEMGGGEFLLPESAELIMEDSLGGGVRNRTRYSRCRQFQAESTLSFAGETKEPALVQRKDLPRLPGRLTMELSLDSEIIPETAAIGDPVRAVLEKPLKDGDRTVALRGAVVQGRVMRVEKEALPYPHYVVALQFHALELEAGAAPFSATMEDAGPAAGLLRETKSMDPVFTKRRVARMDILVRETPRGQGVLHWEARRPRIPRGLRMRWETDPESRQP